MQKIAIIIPYFNEEQRINEKILSELFRLTSVDIYLSNDGSTDNTFSILNAIALQSHENVFVNNYPENQGKAATIYKTVQDALNKDYEYIGYFDADFSTPVSEIERLFLAIQKSAPAFIFGSRILLMNADIKRKWYRHIIGRVIVTLLNLKFNLHIYDTQCGAKIFSREIAKIAFRTEFSTSWLFDVEIFLRLSKENRLKDGVEFPLQKWTDIKGSKLGFDSTFKILKEMYLLTKKY